MPACARGEIVRQGAPGIFHCWARCVRRAWLLGQDPYTGEDYTHRRQWVIDRLQLLVSCFSIDVGFYGVMSNHLHLVLRTNPRLVKRWGDYEVARRWLRVYPGKLVLDGQWIEPSEEQVAALARDKARIECLRKRLSDISWFMRATSEYIARRSNLEDNVTGRFWEGRFSCREVTCESALLVCGVYVDLNQLRAGEVLSPGEAFSSSIGQRLQAEYDEERSWLPPLTLSSDDLGDRPAVSGKRASDKGLLSVSLDAYLRLLTWTIEQKDRPQPQTMPDAVEKTLQSLQIVPTEWVKAVTQFPGNFRRMVGTATELSTRAAQAGRRYFHGARQAARLFR